MLQDSYKLSCRQVLEHFETDAIEGLKTSQIERNKTKFGLNGKINDLVNVKLFFRAVKG